MRWWAVAERRLAALLVAFQCGTFRMPATVFSMFPVGPSRKAHSELCNWCRVGFTYLILCAPFPQIPCGILVSCTIFGCHGVLYCIVACRNCRNCSLDKVYLGQWVPQDVPEYTTNEKYGVITGLI